MGDWLFGVSTARCDGQGVVPDISDKDAVARVGLVAISAMTVGMVLLCSIQATPPKPRQRKHLHHLDFLRIAAIMCVVADHGGGSYYTAQNIFAVQQWVMPCLYMTSAFGFMMSAKGFLPYARRLLAIFLVGWSANCLAAFLKPKLRDKRGRPPIQDGTHMFQMLYVANILALAALCLPIRHFLRTPEAKRRWKLAAFSFWAKSWVVVMTFYLCDLPFVKLGIEEIDSYIRMADEAQASIASTVGLITIVSAACAFGTSRAIGWPLLFYVYAPRVLAAHTGPAHTANHLAQLYIVSVVAYTWKLEGAKQLRSVFRSYWLLVLMGIALLSMPAMVGRCDLWNPGTMWERLRFFAIELVIVLIFLSGALRTAVSDPYGIAPWLSLWALYAYCFHIWWETMLPSPYGVVITFASAPVFWMVHRWTPAVPAIMAPPKASAVDAAPSQELADLGTGLNVA